MQARATDSTHSLGYNEDVSTVILKKKSKLARQYYVITVNRLNTAISPRHFQVRDYCSIKYFYFVRNFIIIKVKGWRRFSHKLYPLS